MTIRLAGIDYLIYKSEVYHFIRQPYIRTQRYQEDDSEYWMQEGFMICLSDWNDV